MRRFVLPLLRCPACLPRTEAALELTEGQGSELEVFEGSLRCPACGASYPIRDGLADLVPQGVSRPPAQDAYESLPLQAVYLSSHYADWCGPPERPEPSDEPWPQAYLDFARALSGDGWEESPKPSLDCGCAVGRLSFEMAATAPFVVGVDLSLAFVRLARVLAARGELGFEEPLEGELTRTRRIRLPRPAEAHKVEFLRADAQRLPFAASSFGRVASVNLVDKLPRPLTHVHECDRVLDAGGRFFLTDPFSWSSDICASGHWLGGTDEGAFSGRALDNLRALLADTLAPGYMIEAETARWWTLRHHACRFERILSRGLACVKRSKEKG